MNRSWQKGNINFITVFTAVYYYIVMAQLPRILLAVVYVSLGKDAAIANFLAAVSVSFCKDATIANFLASPSVCFFDLQGGGGLKLMP